MNNYGKIRPEDIPTVEIAVKVFAKHGLSAGVHGTSLWSDAYTDLDLLVFSEKNDADSFRKALEELVTMLNSSIVLQKGDDEIGLDYELQTDTVLLHLSFVRIL